jgi:hypothetical protein
MFIFQRFDINNQMKLMKLVDFDTLVAVYNRLPDGDYFKQIMNMNFILKKTTHEHNPESLEE